jgi:serine/threonine-protein kinase HipA
MEARQPRLVDRAADRQPDGPRDMRGMDFFENVLPEGPALARMASMAGVRPTDAYGILKAFGRDCAGALMVIPDGDNPGREPASGYEPMTPHGLREVIRMLDAAPLAAAPERGFRPSLAGFQRKALLGRADDGTWQRPHGDAPSTWILKPDGPHPMAANEATCLLLASACGLTAPQCELLDVGGLPVLAVKRYDRRDAADGELPVRIHQEDGCQATATPPGTKHEEARRAGAARLRSAPAELRRPPGRYRPAAQDHVQHGRRQRGRPCQELLRPARPGRPAHQGRAALRRALHDRPRTHRRHQPGDARRHPPGPARGGQADIREVTTASLTDEAVSWGVRRRTATAIVTIDRLLDAIPHVPGDDRVLAAIRVQAQRVRGS